MCNKMSSSHVPKTLRCCTCDREKGPCAVLKVIGFAVQEEDATFEPTLILQGEPFYEQRGAPSQRHTPCGRKGKGGKTKREKKRLKHTRAHTQADRQSQHVQGKGLSCRGHRHLLSQRPQSSWWSLGWDQSTHTKWKSAVILTFVVNKIPNSYDL